MLNNKLKAEEKPCETKTAESVKAVRLSSGLCAFLIFIIFPGVIMAQEEKILISGDISELPETLKVVNYGNDKDNVTGNLWNINTGYYLCMTESSKWFLYPLPSNIKETLTIPNQKWPFLYTKDEYKQMMIDIVGKKQLDEFMK